MFNILLQVLDHSTLTDNNGKKADFRNVIIIMTSNIGTREMSTKSIGFGETQYDTEGKGKKAVENYFSPEFRNRLDNIITFNSLTLEIMKKVVDKFIAELNQQLGAKKVQLTLSPAAREWLAKKGHDPIYGARPLDRLIQKEIKNDLSDQILFGELENGGECFVDVAEDRMIFRYN